MTVLRDISLIWLSVFSLVLFGFLFESRLDRKKTIRLTLGWMLPLLGMNFILMFLLTPEKMTTVVLLTCSLPSLVFFWVLSKFRDGRFFFTFCLADTMLMELLYVTMVLDYYLGDTCWVLFIGRLIGCPLLCWAAYKWLRPVYKKLLRMVTAGWYTFSGMAMMLYVLLSLSAGVPTPVTKRPGNMPEFILLLIFIPLVYTHILRTLIYQQNMNEVVSRENILHVQVSSMQSRLEEYMTANENFRIERHNFRHKLNTIGGLVDKEEYGELRKLLHAYSEDIQETQVKRYCGHMVLDAALGFYLHKAESEDIRVVTKIQFPDSLPVNEAELATVFSNALENAIQACGQLKPQDRYLEVKVLDTPCFMFQISNSFDGAVAFGEDGVPVSGRKGHGFGTRSIVAFCEKNGAFYEFKAENDVFSLRISIHG